VALVSVIVGSIILVTSLLTLDGWAMGAAMVAPVGLFGLRRPESWLA
jgi:hypothetical protein